MANGAPPFLLHHLRHGRGPSRNRSRGIRTKRVSRSSSDELRAGVGTGRRCHEAGVGGREDDHIERNRGDTNHRLRLAKPGSAETTRLGVSSKPTNPYKMGF